MKKNIRDEALFIVMCVLCLWLLLTRCAPTNTAARIPQPVGRVELKSNHHRLVVANAAKYDTVVVYTRDFTIKVVPRTSQLFTRFFNEN